MTRIADSRDFPSAAELAQGHPHKVLPNERMQSDQNGSNGHEAAILILELRISVGSLTTAHHNYLGVRCVPN